MFRWLKQAMARRATQAELREAAQRERATQALLAHMARAATLRQLEQVVRLQAALERRPSLPAPVEQMLRERLVQLQAALPPIRSIGSPKSTASSAQTGRPSTSKRRRRR